MEFTWDENVQVVEKIDGSLILLFNYKNIWRINTRGSFATGELGLGKSWQEIIWSHLDENHVLEHCNSDYTYVMEFVSMHNKIVRNYNGTYLYLLTIVHNETGKEESFEHCDIIASLLNIRRPQRFAFKDSNSIQEFLKEIQGDDPTFEGVIAVDKNFNRIKFKTSTYVALHHLHDNGNLFSFKRLVPLLLLSNDIVAEKEEIGIYFPEAKERIEQIYQNICTEYQSLKSLWENNYQISNQKDFALKIKNHMFQGILFNMRKKYGKEQTEELLKKEWRSNPDLIAKKLQLAFE